MHLRSMYCILLRIFGFTFVALSGNAWGWGQPCAENGNKYVLKNATAYDKSTDRTWKRCAEGQTWKESAGCFGTPKLITFAEAEAMEADGWRLPTKAELQTLVTENCKEPAINTDAFPGISPNTHRYWSSTPSGTEYLWTIKFSNGQADGAKRDILSAARLVRNGQ